MSSFQLKTLGTVLYVLILAGSYVGFDRYARVSAAEVADMLVKSEASAIQQGNLLSSISKFQYAVVTSSTLRAVVVFDKDSDPDFHLPLISIGSPKPASLPLLRLNLFFNYKLLRKLGNGKVLVFYFDSVIANISFLAFVVTLTGALACVILLGIKIETIRSNERLATLKHVSTQVAHDIVSPLTALKISATSLAKKDVGVELLQSGIARIEEIVRDLREDAAKNEQNLFDFTQTVAEVVRTKEAEHATHRFKSALESCHFVYGNQFQIRRVLSNLLNNAVEASPVDSEIKIELSGDQEISVLTISDSGKGMDKETLARVGRRGATFGKVKGLGLGIWHARETLRSMRGWLKIDSQLNVGTSVSLNIPRIATL